MSAKKLPKVYVLLQKGFLWGWNEVDWYQDKHLANLVADRWRKKGKQIRVVHKTPKIWRQSGVLY